MSDQTKPDRSEQDAPSDATVSERNVASLIERAYRPQALDAEFTARVVREMRAAATVRTAGMAGKGAIARLPRRSSNLLAVAATLAVIIGLGWHTFRDLFDAAPTSSPKSAATTAHKASATARLDPGYLAPQALPTPSAAPPLSEGATITTKAGERRRVVLPDHTALYLDEHTSIRHTARRQITVTRGAAYLEVAPATHDAIADGLTPFVVTMPDRQVTALGTRFAVRVDQAAPATEHETSVLVTQGRVQVSGRPDPIDAGQEWVSTPAGDAVRPAPRAAHALNWTRELMAAADAALVPVSRFAGGALVVVKEDGKEQRLSLERYHVDVHVEDGFARTTIDQTFFNHEHQRSEGTFIFPLPADASISRLAMYVGRQLMEGGMVERDRARDIFEEIRYARRDPALLEWIDGTTFKMRVFPIEPREHKRIILCYTQKLDTSYRRTTYRFPAGHSFEKVGQWSFHARIRGAENLTHHCPSHVLTTTRASGDLLLDATAQGEPMNRDVVLTLTTKAATDTARVATDINEGHRYVMLRYRPELPRGQRQQRERRHWVFLLETSADRNPLLSRAQIEVMRTILENVEHDDTFALVTAGTSAKRWQAEAMPATADHVKAAVAFAEKSHLVGALDLEKALTAAAAVCTTARPAPESSVKVTLFHLGTATAALGKRDTKALIDLIPPEVCYVGVQVGNAGTRAFMRDAAAKTGGYVTQINPDEPLAWRAFELISALRCPRLLDVKVTAIPTPADQTGFLLVSDSIIHGEELCAIARLDAKSPAPTRFTVTGALDGKPFEKTLEIKDVAHHAGYLARVWGRLEIDRLVAQSLPKDDAKAAEAQRDRVVALSKSMHVMSPFTSLLVLENDAMYAQYKVERTRRVEWAPYPAPSLLEDPAQMRAATPKVTPQAQPDSEPVPATVDGDSFVQARRLLVDEKIAEAQQAEKSGAFRLAIKLYSDALAIDPSNAPAKAGLAVAQLKVDTGVAPVGPTGVVMTDVGVASLAAFAEFEELMARSVALRDTRNYPLAREAVQMAKVIADRNRGVLGSSSYTALRDRANKMASEVDTLAASHDAIERAKVERQDTSAAELRRQTGELERHQAVQRLLQRAHELRKTQSYDRSLQLIQQALFLDPTNPAAESMKLLVEDSQTSSRTREYMRTRSLRFARHQMEMVEATIPYNELITYPSDWPQLTATRVSRGELRRARSVLYPGLSSSGRATQGGPAGSGPATEWPRRTAYLGSSVDDDSESIVNRRVRRKLQDPLPISFEGNKLVNVVDYFRNTTGVNFFVNWAALEAAGIEQDVPITLQLHEVPAEQALKLVLLQAAGAKERIQHSIIDGVVHISTRHDLVQVTDTRVYDVRELLATAPTQSETGKPLTRDEQVEHMSLLILDTIGDPNEWQHRGGDVSSLRELNGNLIIKTTPNNHRQIIRLLLRLRLARGLDPLAAALDESSPLLRDEFPALSVEHADGPGAPTVVHNLGLTIAAARHYLSVDCVDDAEAAIRPHLREQLSWPSDRIDPDLFRVASAVFYGSGETDMAVIAFERALDAQYLSMGEAVELEPLRDDYTWLLEQYEALAKEIDRIDEVTIKPFIARIVRAADRWRSIDPEPAFACALAARALHALDQHELAWEYETTPLAGRANDAEVLGALARSLSIDERFDIASDIYRAAFEAEPTNPNWLWERAVMLRAAKRDAEAKALLQQISTGAWQTRFSGLVQQAKAALK